MSKKQREFILVMSKEGLLQYQKALYEKLGLQDTDINRLMYEFSLKLKEGLYTITDDGIEYHGHITNLEN